RCRNCARSTDTPGLDFQFRKRIVWLFHAANPHRANLELRYIRHWIDRTDSHVVGGAVERPVIRHEHRVGTDRLNDLRTHYHIAVPSLDLHEGAVEPTELFSQAWMHLA